MWAIARRSPPVFCSKAVIHFQRSTGLSLPSGFIVVYGSICSAFVASSRKITFRWRLLPPVFDVHSKPMKAVKRPDSFASSAAFTAFCQAPR